MSIIVTFFTLRCDGSDSFPCFRPSAYSVDPYVRTQRFEHAKFTEIISKSVTYTYRWFDRQICLSVFIALQGLGTIFQPWSTQLWQLYVCIFVYGFGIGNWNGSNNVILIEMWQEKSPSILQFSQFIYGVGTILGPLLTERFVIGEQVCPGYFPEDVPKYCYSNETLNVTDKEWCDYCLNYDRRPEVKKPLLIGGLLQLIGRSFRNRFLYR